jgi:hypothetical protein
MRRDRGGCLLYSGAAVSSRSPRPRQPAPAASQRLALYPAGTSHRRGPGSRSIRRFTSVHPSGLPLACSPRMERGRLRLLPRAPHPTVTRDTRQGGDGPADTEPGHTLINSTSKRYDQLTTCGFARRTVTLPVPWRAAGACLGRPLIDHRHAGQRPGPPGIRAVARLAAAPASPQHPGQVPAQPAQLRAVDRPVDGLVHGVPPGIAGELAAQRVADLFRAPPPLAAPQPRAGVPRLRVLARRQAHLPALRHPRRAVLARTRQDCRPPGARSPGIPMTRAPLRP